MEEQLVRTESKGWNDDNFRCRSLSNAMVSFLFLGKGKKKQYKVILLQGMEQHYNSQSQQQHYNLKSHKSHAE